MSFDVVLRDNGPGGFDVSLSTGGAITVTVNQATETDLAQPIASAKVKVLGLVSETDLAQVISINPLRRLVLQVAETDLAQPITASLGSGGPFFVTVNQVAETDIAQAVSRVKTRTVGQVFETNTVFAMAPIKIKGVLQATETDLAQPIARVKIKGIGQVSETDLAQAILVNPIRRLVNQVTEFDQAFPITREGAAPTGNQQNPRFIANINTLMCR